MVFFKPGDIVKWRQIDRGEYDAILADVSANRYTPKVAEVSFDLEAFSKDPSAYNAKLLEALR
jgi:hypothetical protein